MLRHACNRTAEVVGSIPIGSTNDFNTLKHSKIRVLT